MGEFIHNPRRSPRVPVRFSVRIALRNGDFLEARTLNVGPGGCAVETSRRVEPGERAFAEIKDARVGAHVLVGRVAWTSSAPPWRSGIAFDAASGKVAARLFSELASGCPDAVVVVDAVEKIPADAVLAPTPVPGGLAVVAAEAEVLQAVGSGIEAGALRDRLGDRWDSHVNALFALLERGVVEVSRPAAGRATPKSR
jgi:PilZ domain